MQNQFIISGEDAINIAHLIAVGSDDYGHYAVITDAGDRLGITYDMYKRIMAVLHNQKN